MGEGEAEGAAAAHQCGWAWLCYDTYEQVARLAGSLDARGGGREAALKARLLEVLPLLEQTMEEGSLEDAAAEWLLHGHPWLGERAIRRFKVRGLYLPTSPHISPISPLHLPHPGARRAGRARARPDHALAARGPRGGRRRALPLLGLGLGLGLALALALTLTPALISPSP